MSRHDATPDPNNGRDAAFGGGPEIAGQTVQPDGATALFCLAEMLLTDAYGPDRDACAEAK